VAALKTSPFDKNKYGTAFWQALLTEYAPLATASSDTRSGSSREAGTKNNQEELVRQMLCTLCPHIKNNFPDTCRAEWRSFGYLRESYYRPGARDARPQVDAEGQKIKTPPLLWRSGGVLGFRPGWA